MRFCACVILTTSLLALTSCGGDSKAPATTGELVTDTVHLDSDGIDSAAIHLNMGVGELDVSGGADSGLVDGKLEYNVPSWKPRIVQSKDGHSAQLTIEQLSSTKTSGDSTKNTWALKVADTTPVTFDIDCGVGQANLSLGSLKLRQVSLNVGVGKIDLDLRGRPDHDYTVKVHGGVGQATIHVPSEASVRANVQTGLAPVKVEGLEKHGEAWESPDYGKAKPSIALDVEGGIGEIRIVR